MTTSPAVLLPVEPSHENTPPLAPPPNVGATECPADDDDDARWDALPCTD